MVDFPWVPKTVICPVSGCTEVAHSAVWMREHFMYRHSFARIAVVQEGREPLPHCDLCGMFMLERRLLKHHQTKWCD